MKKLIPVLILALCLAACGGGKTVKLSGELKDCTAKNYTLKLPVECEAVASEISDLSASYESCSVAVVSMPLEQTVVCEDKKEYTDCMEALGYNLEVTDYEKTEINGLQAYRAEYILGESRVIQTTFAHDGTAYIATYACPSDLSTDADEVFLEGINSFEILEKD